MVAAKLKLVSLNDGVVRNTYYCPDDPDGARYTTFEVDAFALESPGECSICGATGLESGYLCLDGGEEFCNDCVEEVDAE